MKKYILLAALLIVSTLALSACNKSLLDTTYKFDRAIVKLADGSTVTGKVQAWTDYEDGDQIQVKIDNVTYLVHSTDVTLISE